MASVSGCSSVERIETEIYKDYCGAWARIKCNVNVDDNRLRGGAPVYLILICNGICGLSLTGFGR